MSHHVASPVLMHCALFTHSLPFIHNLVFSPAVFIPSCLYFNFLSSCETHLSYVLFLVVSLFCLLNLLLQFRKRFICSSNKTPLHCPSHNSAQSLRGCTSTKHLFQWVFGWPVPYTSTNFDLSLQFPFPFPPCRFQSLLNNIITHSPEFCCLRSLTGVISFEKYFPQVTPQGQCEPVADSYNK